VLKTTLPFRKELFKKGNQFINQKILLTGRGESHGHKIVPERTESNIRIKKWGKLGGGDLEKPNHETSNEVKKPFHGKFERGEEKRKKVGGKENRA